MIFAQSVTSQSVDVRILDDSMLPVTGLVAATFPTLKYSLAGPNADGSFPALTDLAAITTAWASGGVKERGNGVYRLDLPDAVFAAVGKVTVRGDATGKHVQCPVIEVGVVVPDTAGTTTLLARVTSGRAGNLDNLDASISSVGTLVSNASVVNPDTTVTPT